MESPHFSPVGLRFLRSLKRNNDREWFNARKGVYEAELKAPMLAVVEAVSRAMEGFASDHVRPAHKVMMRIYRDTRFAKDKRPYKHHVSAWWAQVGMEKTSGGGFYLHVSPEEVLVSCGVYMPEREQLLAIRRCLEERHGEYRALHGGLLRKKAMGWTGIDAQALSRTPKGFAKGGPAEDLLRAQNWGIHAVLPAEVALSAGFAREVVKRFQAAAPLVAFLNEPIRRTLRKPVGERMW